MPRPGLARHNLYRTNPVLGSSAVELDQGPFALEWKAEECDQPARCAEQVDVNEVGIEASATPADRLNTTYGFVARKCQTAILTLAT